VQELSRVQGVLARKSAEAQQALKRSGIVDAASVSVALQQVNIPQ
jgi:hypothetical protein